MFQFSLCFIFWCSRGKSTLGETKNVPPFFWIDGGCWSWWRVCDVCEKVVRVNHLCGFKQHSLSPTCLRLSCMGVCMCACHLGEGVSETVPIQRKAPVHSDHLKKGDSETDLTQGCSRCQWDSSQNLLGTHHLSDLKLFSQFSQNIITHWTEVRDHKATNSQSTEQVADSRCCDSKHNCVPSNCLCYLRVANALNWFVGIWQNVIAKKRKQSEVLCCGLFRAECHTHGSQTRMCDMQASE